MDADGGINLAKAELELADEEVKNAKAAGGNPGPIKRKELDRLRAQFAREAQSRRDVLVKYTTEVKKKKLEAAIQQARADEQAKHTKWEHEAQKEKSLDVCRIIVAPIDGRLRYRKNRAARSIRGAQVNYLQELFRIDPEPGSSPPDPKETHRPRGEDSAPNPQP